MKAVRLLEYGGQLVFNDVPTPTIAPDEIPKIVLRVTEGRRQVLSFQRPFGRAWRPAQSGSFVSLRPNSRSRPAMSAL
jgi:hypothetical protein